jgi:glutathione S-transferase
MSANDRIALSGAPGSPYTRKMLAVLRYRRIPYRFLPASGPALDDLPRPKVQLLPTVYLPGRTGELEAVVDSTPIIRRLEEEREGRSLIPHDPALAFLDELIEDYADEWLTKAMFHYRWAYAADIDQAARILPCWRGLSVPDAILAERAKVFADRQIGRLHVVRFLEAFEAHLAVQPFLLGGRPGAGDFAVFGQLTQLAQFDPTPMALTLKMAPRVFAWVSLMEDQSGLEPSDGDWIDPVVVSPTLTALLREIGRVYPPVMLANAQALLVGAQILETEIDGQPWVQPPFAYQAKCLQWLCASHGALPAQARATVDRVLAETGCGALFA